MQTKQTNKLSTVAEKQFEILTNRILKKGLSFYISDKNNRRRSSTWVIKKDVRKKDNSASIYVYERTFGGKNKLSLHPNLDCQWGMVGNYYDKMKEIGGGTFDFIRWKRRETPEKGAIYVASIRFPTDFMQGDFSEYQENKKAVFSFEIAPAGKSINFGIYFSKESPENLEEAFLKKGMTPIFCFDMDNGEFVSFVYQIQTFKHKLPTELLSGERVGREIEPVMKSGESISNLGAVLVSQRTAPGKPIELIEMNGFSVKKH